MHVMESAGMAAHCAALQGPHDWPALLAGSVACSTRHSAGQLASLAGSLVVSVRAVRQGKCRRARARLTWGLGGFCLRLLPSHLGLALALLARPAAALTLALLTNLNAGGVHPVGSPVESWCWGCLNIWLGGLSSKPAALRKPSWVNTVGSPSQPYEQPQGLRVTSALCTGTRHGTV